MNKKIRDVIIAYDHNQAKFISDHNYVDIKKAIVFKHHGITYPDPKLDSQFLKLQGFSGTFRFNFEKSECEIINSHNLCKLIYDLLAPYNMEALIKYNDKNDEKFKSLLCKFLRDKR